jgi:NAD(P)-dependent dehydrogenase (short-subunit alcohol dehydrogenase family)
LKLAGNAFIVTGGASGLGEATVRRLHGAGAHVVIADIALDRGQALVRELGSSVAFTAADVADSAQVAASIAVATQRYGSLSGAILCAGIAPAERVLGKTGPHALESFERALRVNLTGTFNVIRLAAAAMQDNPPNPEGERGVIITTASIAAFEGQIGQAAYSASKAGVAGMTLPIARELARFSIRVMTIAPGLFQTPMFAGLPPDAQAALGGQTPFPARLGRPEEYAMLVEHILANPMLNGSVIRLDGAVRLGPK